jgi:eukaryotic translation initiation factor 2C
MARGAGPSSTRGGGPGSGRGRGRAASPAPSTAGGQAYPRGRGSPGGGGYGGPRGRGGPPSGPLIYQENVRAQVPSQLEPAALQRLIENFKSIKVSADRPLRPGYGSVGTPVKLRTNFFAVKIRKEPIYDYTVTIEPTTDIRRLKTRVFQLLEQNPMVQPHIPYIAHDSSQRLVAAKKLPQPLHVPVKFYEDNEKGPGPKAKVYTVSIKLERELDITELDK